MANNLSFYGGTPFVSSNQIDLVDTYTAPGGVATFYLTNKTVPSLSSTIQAGNLEYYQFNGGFTTNQSNQSFTLATNPPIGTQMVAPGINQLVLSAFDQDTVLGVSNPRTASIPIWLVDPTTINNYKYSNLPSYPGLQISVVQLISGSNAQPSWIQMASADASGNAMTYGATGGSLYLPSIDAFTTLASTCTAGSNLLYVVAASGATTRFWPGQYISLNIGNSTSEIVHVISINYSTNVLTIDPSGVTYTHSPGETVYACGWKFWMQCTIPLNANSNTAVNLYNLGLQRLGAIRARP
jgi:hypothetical protein